MDIGDCNSEFPILFSEDNPCRLTHIPLILSQTGIRRYCVQLKQYMQWIDWMRKTWEQPQITPVWATSTTLLLPPRKKQGVIRNNSGKSTERTTKVLQLIQYLIQLCQHKIYITHTILPAQTQIWRECPLFIRGFSNWAFSISLTERHKQTIWCPVACTTVAAGFGDKLI